VQGGGLLDLYFERGGGGGHHRLSNREKLREKTD
jgi:hypothetical protein